MAIQVSETEILKASAQYPAKAIEQVADLAALKAVSGMGDAEVRLVPALGLFHYDSSSAATADDITIVDPTVGSGQWLLERGNETDGTLVWDPANLVDGAGETSSGITVTGASLGDYVLVSAPYDLQGILAHAYVSAADTVKIRIQNETGGAINLASGTWKVRVIK